MEHLITPPPELISQWFDESPYRDSGKHVAIQSARWGADQELDACCGWIEGKSELGVLSVIPEVCAKFRCQVSDQLRTACRPKQPSLKQQALEQLRGMEQAGALDCNIDAIRRALESLPDPQD